MELFGTILDFFFTIYLYLKKQKILTVIVVIIIIVIVVVVFIELVAALLLNLSVGEVTGRVGGQTEAGQELHHQE